MKCLECKDGDLRAFTPVACTCGHYPLFCAACGTWFTVRCLTPSLAERLPSPEDLAKDEDMMAHMARAEERFSKAERDAFLAKYPLVEAFRATLLAENAGPAGE